MGRSKKTLDRETIAYEDEKFYLDLENDNQALRGKNRDLVMSVAKLQQDKSLLQKELNSMKQQYICLNSKYVNLKNIFLSAETSIKTCFPKAADVAQQLVNVLHLFSVGSIYTNLNKDTKTQAVSPHTVNGTVIQNPTITLARFNDGNNSLLSQPLRQQSNLSNSSNHPNVSPHNRQDMIRDSYQDPRPSTSRGPIDNSNDQDPRPSTSRGLQSNIRTNEVINNSGDISANEEINDFNFTIRNRRCELPLPVSSEESQILNDDIVQDELDESNEEYCPRLLTIAEEDETNYSNINSTSSEFIDRVREIRVYLSPLRVPEKLEASSPKKDYTPRTSSVSGEPSETLIDNSIFNESNTSFKNVTFADNFSAQGSRIEQNSEIFTLENSDWKNNNLDSFSFGMNLSQCNSPNGAGTSRDYEESKLMAMESLGLEPTSTHMLTTSTPLIVQSPKTRSRVSKIFNNPTESTASRRSLVTKRKASNEVSPQGIIKRLNLDGSPRKKSENLDTNLKNKQKKQKIPKKKFKPKVLNEQEKKSSPRPSRAARPQLLRETSLRIKLRRSK